MQAPSNNSSSGQNRCKGLIRAVDVSYLLQLVLDIGAIATIFVVAPGHNMAMEVRHS